jgi:hypothetical protein
MVLKNALDVAKNRFLAYRLVKRLFNTKVLSLIREREIIIIYLAFLFILSSGIINAILEGSNLPASALPILRRRDMQTTTETLLYFFTIVLGTSGLFIAYSGSKRPLQRRISDFYLVAGLSLVVVGVIVGLTIISIKGF